MVKISATKQKLKQKAKRANPNSQFNKNKLNNRKGNKPAVSVLKRQNQKSTKSKISESREKRERKQDRKQSFKPKENNHFEKPKEKQKDLEIVELENENGAEDYEKTPRKSSDKQKKVFNRMPVKDDKGKVVFPKENLEPVRADENEDDSIENDETVDQDVDSEMADEAKNPETVEERDLRRQNARIQIAQFASKILSGPEEHVLKFDPLINLCKENDELIQRLAVASVTELFKETIPGYKIREPTERELQQKLSKEVKALWTFEKNYLQRYKSFISLLVSRTKALTRQLGQMKKLKSAEGELDLTSNMEKNIIALKCACQLLLHAPHFNFTKDIVHAVTGFLSVDQKEISSIVYDCISSLFKKDKLNDVSIEIVQKLVEVIKNDPYIENELVLKVLLSLPFHDSLVDADVGRENESDKSTGKKKSKEEKEALKQLKKDLAHSEAEISSQRRKRTQLQLLEKVFFMYFRILKDSQDSPLIPAVLEGLAKFGHLINAELIIDVVDYLKTILKAKKLTFESTLHCVIASLDILSGTGECLSIDISEIHDVLFSNLSQLIYQPEYSALFVKSLWKSVVARREVDVGRIFSLIRKASEMVLYLPPGPALGMMHFIRTAMEKYSYVSKMFETDHVDWEMPIGSSEYCGSVAWEVLLLKHSYHPAVQNYGKILAKGTSSTLPSALASTNGADLVNMYDSLKCIFNPAVKFPSFENVKKRNFSKFQWHLDCENAFSQTESTESDLSSMLSL